MKDVSYTKLLIASVVSFSIAAGPVLAQDATPAPVAPAAPSAAAPAAEAAVEAAPVAAAEPAPGASTAEPAVTAASATATAAAANDPWQQEFALWQAAAAGNTVEEYQGYLKAYPGGKFAEIAQARIVKLAVAEEKAESAAADAADQARFNQAPAMQANTASPAANSTFTVGTPMEEGVILGDRTTRREVQGRLTSLGFSTGGTDGVMGPRSRAAISQWQTVISAPVSGYLSYDQLAKLRADSANVYASWLASRPKALPPIRPNRNDQLVGRVNDDSADAAIALGMLGLAAGVIGGAAIAGGRHHHYRGGPRYYGPRGGFHRGHRRH